VATSGARHEERGTWRAVWRPKAVSMEVATAPSVPSLPLGLFRIKVSLSLFIVPAAW